MSRQARKGFDSDRHRQLQEHGQEGVEFADPMPERCAGSGALTSAKEIMEPYAEQSSYAKYYAQKSPFDIRHVTQTIMLGPIRRVPAGFGKQMVWMRADGEVMPQVMHRAMLAMVTDHGSCWSRCRVVPV